MKFRELPDACKSLSEGTIKNLVPKADSGGGKRIGAGNANDSGSCLWSGLDKFDYRQLTISLKRFDSDAARGSGDKLAQTFLDSQTQEVKSNGDNQDVKATDVNGVAEKATSLGFDVKKKDAKDKSEEFREQRVIARNANVVVTVDYEGAGFEDGKKPDADDLKKKAEKAAQEAIASVK